MRLKVLISSNIPSPYFVNYCDELGKYVDLTVVFELKAATDRDDSWICDLNQFNFKTVYLNAKRVSHETGLSFKIRRFIKNNSFDRIIVANPMTLTGIFTLWYLKKHKIKFIIQSEGGFQGTGKGLKEKIKKCILRGADMYLTGMGDDKDYFLVYGATKDKLRRYNFTSSYSRDIDKKILNNSEKNDIKKELNINFDKMILYVGQFIHRKGVDILLKSCINNNDDTCLYAIGGMPTEEYLNIIKSYNIKNVFFLPFIDKMRLIRYYQAADIFVMTTREDTWGLVINEAMGHGLPIITTNMCIAGLELIEEGVNGYIVDTEDYITTSKYIIKLLQDNKLRNYMGKNNLTKIKDYTIENMAKDVFNYIK